LLPLKKAAVFVGTKTVGPQVCFQLGREETMRFHSLPVVMVGGIVKGGRLVMKEVISGFLINSGAGVVLKARHLHD
jgi:hypothetical protein